MPPREVTTQVQHSEWPWSQFGCVQGRPRRYKEIIRISVVQIDFTAAPHAHLSMSLIRLCQVEEDAGVLVAPVRAVAALVSDTAAVLAPASKFDGTRVTSSAGGDSQTWNAGALCLGNPEALGTAVADARPFFVPGSDKAHENEGEGRAGGE